ncbi:MAG: hypothetical protein GF350_05740 [Chitinivibrionales bacterium]|nr:hypothetical protein [Chitinivibrionales bacterium]
MLNIDIRKGVPLVGPYTALAAAGAANAAAIWQVSDTNVIGTKSYRIKRIWGLNAAGVNTLLHIGTGVGGAFVDVIPPWETMNGLNFEYPAALFTGVELAVDLTAYPVVATVSVQVEVEEIG